MLAVDRQVAAFVVAELGADTGHLDRTSTIISTVASSVPQALPPLRRAAGGKLGPVGKQPEEHS